MSRGADAGREEFIQNHTRTRRHSYRDGTNTLSLNAGFNRSANEIRRWKGRRRMLLEFIQNRTRERQIPNEMGQGGEEQQE
jgi:hypothetical protein